jgi:hypothetical protein
MTPEGKVKAKVKRALEKLRRKYHFMPVQNGMGAPALDIFCCIEGFFVAIETKVPGKHMTERQMVTASQIADAGGLVFVIHDDDEIEAMMHRIDARVRGSNWDGQISQGQ